MNTRPGLTRAGDRMRRSAWIYATVLFMIPLIVPVTGAGDCRYGSIHAWFQGSAGGWQNATAHPMLRPGQAFQIKITVMMTRTCRMFFLKLHEFGTPVYEVLTGPMRLEELFKHQGGIQRNESYTYTWTLRVRPATTWTQASAPLEVFAQFNDNDSESCEIDFDVINAYIQPGFPRTSEAPQEMEHHVSNSHQGQYVLGIVWRESLLILLMIGVLLSLKHNMSQRY
jgi:sarcinarray family protein